MRDNHTPTRFPRSNQAYFSQDDTHGPLTSFTLIEMEHSEYVSCIKINGVPILPPLVIISVVATLFVVIDPGSLFRTDD